MAKPRSQTLKMKPTRAISLIVLFSAFALAFPAMARAANPVPFLNGISPSAAAPGGSAFTLTITGAGFAAGAVVNWQLGPTTTALATTFLSDTHLTATVPASLIATTATAWVTVANPGPGSVMSNPASFDVTVPNNTLRFDLDTFMLGQCPDSVVVADFNGDGKSDLAVASANTGELFILLGNGDGTFHRVPEPFVGNSPSVVAAGDFNNDGKKDLLIETVTVGNTETLSVFLGNGDGTFTRGPKLALPTNYFVTAVADFDSNGTLDLAVGSDSTLVNTIFILLGNGDGTFTMGATATAGVAPAPGAVGDFNGDGKLDLAVSNAGDGTVSILLGNGDGTFTNGATLRQGSGNILAQDFNGDGILDLAIIDSTCTVPILLGNGDGTFTPFMKLRPPKCAINGITADVNGDGKMDLVLTDYVSGTFVTLLGNGDGTFARAHVFRLGSLSIMPVAVAAADFNADGRTDLAIADFGNIEHSTASNVAILLQSNTGDLDVPSHTEQ